MVCQSNLRQLGVSTLEYAGDYGVFPPFRLKKYDGVDFVNSFGRKKPRWQWFLHGHIQPVIDPTGFPVPFGDSDVSTDGRTGRDMTSTFFLDPGMNGEYARDIRNGPYGYNYQFLGNSREVEDGIMTNWPVGEARIVMPSQTVAIADSRGGDIDHGKHAYTLDPPKKGLAEDGTAMEFGPDGSSDGPIGHSPVELRHRGKGNVVFLDTHVEAMAYRDLGYALDEDGVPVPVDPLTSAPEIVAESDNRLWTGTGQDQQDPPRSIITP